MAPEVTAVAAIGSKAPSNCLTADAAGIIRPAGGDLARAGVLLHISRLEEEKGQGVGYGREGAKIGEDGVVPVAWGVTSTALLKCGFRQEDHLGARRVPSRESLIENGPGEPGLDPPQGGLYRGSVCH